MTVHREGEPHFNTFPQIMHNDTMSTHMIELDQQKLL